MVLITRAIVIAAALMVTAAAAHADSTACSAGPGAAFGVTAYNCSKCAIDTKTPGRTTFLFESEPTILSVDPGSALKPGDVVISIDGHRLTTRTGAERFTYPEVGPATIAVRRGGVRLDLKVQAVACQTEPAASSAPAASVPAPRASSDPPTGRFGFAVACKPSCSRTRASDGTDYWKFDGEPPVAALRDGPARAAGMQIGDRVVAVDGAPILTEGGALRLLRSQNSKTLSVTVKRGERQITFDLRADGSEQD